MEHVSAPRAQGLYDPRHEHDSCGIGFVVDAHGRKSHGIVEQAVQVLLNLEHRGACGCEKNTGDGAGILLQMPHGFLADACGEAGVALPGPGRYGAALVFLPTDPVARRRCEEIVERTAAEEGVRFLGWRTVPTDNASLGATARAGEPAMRQAFFGRPEPLEEDLAYERKLYVLRRRIENAVRASDVPGRGLFYVPSLSHRTLVYKGMLIAPQLPAYFPDIVDPRVESCLAMVHSRFSTNTFPNWARAHPYRFVCHNGEINTLRGNVNWMHARESLFESKLFGDDLAKILPVVDAEGSDSAMFDNVLELLVLAGRSLPHAVMMMIPEPWAGHESMNEKKRAFYEYHSCLMEPWDGPAAIAFTDGVRIGATLDRNGLRPVALLRDQGRPGGDGVGGGRSRHPGRPRAAEGPAAARADVPRRHRGGPGRRGRGDQAAHRQRAAVRRLAARQPRLAAGRAGGPQRARGRPRDGPAAAARLRLHPRGPRAAAHADGQGRRRARGLDGQRHAPGGPLGQAAAALQLLQAALRAGHEPARSTPSARRS